MNLLIVEPEATGHRMALYVRLVVRAAKARGWSVSLLTTRRATEHPAFQLVLDEVKGELPVYFMDLARRYSSSHPLALLKQQYVYYVSLRRAFRRLAKGDVPDLVHISCLDDFDKVLAFLGTPFGSVPFLGLLTSVKFHRHRVGIGPPSRSDNLYEWLFKRVLATRTLKRLLSIDEAFVSFASQSGCPLYEKVALIPDVGEIVGDKPKESVRNEIGIAQGTFVILVYGSLSRRKGIEELLNAAVLPGAPANLRILLAGAPDQFVQSLLSNSACARKLRAEGKLVERLRFHDDQDEYRVFRAADVVWLGYVGGSYGSSGVLYQASSVGLPLIATSRGLIGWITERHGLGLMTDPADPDSVVRAIRRLSADTTLRTRIAGRAEQYAASHTAARYGDAVCLQLHNAIDIYAPGQISQR